MSTIKASLLVPGDKFFYSKLLKVDKRVHECKLHKLVCVQTELLKDKSIVFIKARDSETNKELTVSFTADTELVLLPKPGKWSTIWKLLRG